MKILLVRNDNLGDLICTTPSIEALRKKYPKATIDIVVNSYNYLAIRNNPFVDKIYVYTKPEHQKFWFHKFCALLGKIKTFVEIAKKKYDVCIVFRGTYSPFASQFALVSSAKTKIGVKNPKGWDCFNYHIPYPNRIHEVEFCFKCIEPLEVKYSGENLFFYLEDHFITNYSHLNIDILFHISSRKEQNRFPFEKWKSLILDVKKLGYNVYFTASPKDWSLAERLEKSTNAKFLKTENLLNLAGIIKNAKVLVTLDGGTVHLGPALGTKTIAIFGSTPLERWYPWGYKNFAIKSKTGIAKDIDNELILEKIEKIWHFNF